MPKAPKMSGNARMYCFTAYGDELINAVGCGTFELPSGVRYLCAQVELGHRNNRLHVQGFLVFDAPAKWTRVKTVLGAEDIHVERSRGSFTDNVAYCTKVQKSVSKPIVRHSGVWGVAD